MAFQKIISIQGVPRSGTSWLGQIFDSSPNVKYKYQPLFSYAFKNEIDFNMSYEELMKFYTRLYNYRDNFLDQIYKKNQEIYPKFENKLELPENLVTKMVRYHYLIPFLLKEIEEFICIFIIRHPCGVLNSWKNNPREFNENWNFKNEWRYAQQMNEFKPEQYFGFNKWKEFSKLAIEMKKTYPKKVFIIQYENLVKNLNKNIDELFEFCNIEKTEQITKFIKKSTTVHQDDPSSVFKGKKNIYSWEDELDKEVIRQIKDEITNTELEKFLV